MGDLLARRGDTTSARRQYRDAVRLDRANRRASAALQALGAIPNLERAARESPGDLDLLADLGVTYFLTGRYERARELANRVLRQAPDHPGANQLMRQLGSPGQIPNE